MAELNNYPVDFVKRTKELLNQKFDEFQEIDREVTFLLNCLLGLVVTVSESEKKKNTKFRGLIDNDFLKIVPDTVGFIVSVTHETDLTEIGTNNIQFTVGSKNDLKQKSKLWFLNRIRNGIAHQNIQDVKEDGVWAGVRLWNENGKLKDFEIRFTIDELRVFADTIATIYLASEPV